MTSAGRVEDIAYHIDKEQWDRIKIQLFEGVGWPEKRVFPAPERWLM